MSTSLRFKADFDFVPPDNLNRTYAYQAGRVYKAVPADHATAALAAGAAEAEAEGQTAKSANGAVKPAHADGEH